MLAWWGDAGSNVKTNDASVVGDVTGFSILPGSDDVYNSKTGAWDKLASGPNHAPNWPISAGAFTSWRGRLRREEEEGSVVGCGPSRRQGSFALDGGLSVGLPALPQLHFNIPEWVAAGYDEAFITSYLKSNRDSYNHPNAAIEPRIPGIFQYYSVAEDELAKTFAGQATAQQPAPTPSPRPGRRSLTRSDARIRSSSTRPRSACRPA